MSTMIFRKQEKAAATLRDPRWQQVVARDAGANGSFWYSVATTGVYCLPSCSARLANPENVRFHASIVEAEQSGFRACRRCRPNERPGAEQRAEIVTRACRTIEEAETLPPLNELAALAGLSEGYFHRLFKATVGMTPKAYASAHRAALMRKHLGNGDSVTSAILNAGFNSSSRFYEKSVDMLGMSPRQFRNGGADMAVRFAVGQCALGAILVASSEKGVCAVLLGDDPELLVRELQDQFPKAELLGDNAQYERLVAKVIGFVEAPELGHDLPLDIRGTTFQRRVWSALQEIEPGRALTYTELADRIGQPRAVRAVASACAANLLAVAIPCHRVIRTDGALSGYRWGVARKRHLLEREKSQARG